MVVRVVRNGCVERICAFDQDQIVIGRERYSHIVLSSREVSRVHCLLERIENHVYVIDPGSSNGTRVNGKAVRRSALEPGDVVQIGEFTLSVELVDDRASASVEQAVWHQGEPTIGSVRP